MSRWLDEEETAVDSGVLDISFTLSSKLLAQVGGVLVFNVLDDRVPAVKSISPDDVQSGSTQRPGSTYHLSLLTWSPYPGVSTMFNLRRTPFSSMTIKHDQIWLKSGKKKGGGRKLDEMRRIGTTYCVTQSESP